LIRFLRVRNVKNLVAVLVFPMIRIKAAGLNMTQVLLETVAVLASGGIVAYPTETFYGLGVKYDLEDSLEKLYLIKKRPREKAMPLIIGNRALLSSLTDSIGTTAESLMERFWPGPLTLLFRARKSLSHFITAGTGKVAVRIPGKSFALELVETAGFPITATSANPSGLPPARDADTVVEYFGTAIDLIIDAGPTAGRLPSTIVDTTAGAIEIVREGVIRKKSLLDR
jgi:L-threonylcarbamoyladenylate synthase